jgi:hypothetical protein
VCACMRVHVCVCANVMCAYVIVVKCAYMHAYSCICVLRCSGRLCYNKEKAQKAYTETVTFCWCNDVLAQLFTAVTAYQGTHKQVQA